MNISTSVIFLGNGTIEIDEFVEMMKDKVLTNGENEDDVVLETFNVFDVDSTGLITCDNLQKVFSGLGIKCSDDEIKLMVDGADLKKDGVIDFEGMNTILYTSKDSINKTRIFL